MGCFFFFLPPSADSAQINMISTNGKEDVLKQPVKVNTDLLYFLALSYYKCSAEKISLYLPSHFRIRIIVLTYPENKSARNQPKSCLQCKITEITMMRGQYYFNWNLCSLSVCSCSCEDSRVPPLNVYYDISIAEDLHCFKAVNRNFVRNGGTTRTHSRRIRLFALGSVYPNKSLTMCSSDFIFRKYKQDSAFRVSGVLQLAKTGPSLTKNFPLCRLFPSDAMMAWRFYTPYDVKCTNF